MSRKVNLFFVSALIVMAATNTTQLGNVYAQESTYGPVKSGELIWNIAGKVTPNASVSRQQVIMGLLHTNPSAFKVSCNFNSLKVGEKLTIPALTDIQALSQEEAKKEFDGQNEAWKNRKKNPIVCPTPEVAPTAPVATATSPTTPPAPPPAAVTPPKETPTAIAPKPSDSSTGAPTPPPTTPVVPPVTAVPHPTETTTAPPVVSPPPEAPKPASENAASPPPVALTNATLPTPASATGATPTAPSSDSPPKTPSQLPDLIIWILIGGGLLSAFIIAGLLHVHARNEASVPANPNKYDFAESKKSASDEGDDMPLHPDPGEDRPGDVIKD